MLVVKANVGKDNANVRIANANPDALVENKTIIAIRWYRIGNGLKL